MTASDFLDRILARRRERLAAAKDARPLAALARDAERVRGESARHAFSAALDAGAGVKVIAEFKRASPSKGLIRGDASPAETAGLYEQGGASAVSVLTEEDFFRGSLRDLVEVKSATRLPALRKDFIFDEYQIYEAAAAGADAVLLIVAMLGDDELARLRRLAEDALGLDALVEVHDAEEMGRAARAGARLVGVNNRDLRSFRVSLETSIELAPLAPEGAVLVSESGVETFADVRRLRSCGYAAFLVGEALMRAASPAAALRALRGEAGGGAAGAGTGENA
jgi:indole-3-glycerol phosphate synthase